MKGATLYIFAHIALVNVLFLKSSSTYQSTRLYNNIFGASENSIPGILILNYFISFMWLTVSIFVPAVFTLVNSIFSSILKNEFAFISDDIKRCVTKTTGEKIFKDYDRALETGKLIDDTMSLSMSTVLSYIMLMLFHHGSECVFLQIWATFR